MAECEAKCEACGDTESTGRFMAEDFYSFDGRGFADVRGAALCQDCGNDEPTPIADRIRTRRAQKAAEPVLARARALLESLESGEELRVGDWVWHRMTKRAGTVAGLEDVGSGNILIDWGDSTHGALPQNLEKLPPEAGSKTPGGETKPDIKNVTCDACGERKDCTKVAGSYSMWACGLCASAAHPDVLIHLFETQGGGFAAQPPTAPFPSYPLNPAYAIAASKPEPDYSPVAAYAVQSKPVIDPRARPEWPYDRKGKR